MSIRLLRFLIVYAYLQLLTFFNNGCSQLVYNHFLILKISKINRVQTTISASENG